MTNMSAADDESFPCLCVQVNNILTYDVIGSMAAFMELFEMAGNFECANLFIILFQPTFVIKYN